MKTEKKCRNCKQPFQIFKSTDVYCSKECYKEHYTPKINLKPMKNIPKVSEKRKIEDLKYRVLRIEFLGKPENQICPITKWPSTEIHHTYCGKDRAKYYLDTSTWIAVSRDGHNWIHDNPKEARDKGFLK